jgi:ribose-phosphate pyrophosphokinase
MVKLINWRRNKGKNKRKKVCKNMFIACSGGKHLASSLARKTGGCSCILETEIFPDSELRIRLPKEVKNWDVYFVQSFYKDQHDVNDKLVEILFAAETAKELGAKNIYLIAPYLSYLREDFRFREGEAISAKILSKLCKIFKKVYVVEPHLHRLKTFKEFFPNAQKISLSEEIASYIKKNIGKCMIVGPDEESEQWVKPIADKLKTEYVILEKHRFSARKVKTEGRNISADKVVIIDDIISTGNTLIEASKLIKAKKIYFIAAHGVFAEGALKKLNKHGKVIVSNTIPTKVSDIDCTSAISKVIKLN